MINYKNTKIWINMHLSNRIAAVYFVLFAIGNSSAILVSAETTSTLETTESNSQWATVTPVQSSDSSIENDVATNDGVKLGRNGSSHEATLPSTTFDTINLETGSGGYERETITDVHEQLEEESLLITTDSGRMVEKNLRTIEPSEVPTATAETTSFVTNKIEIDQIHVNQTDYVDTPLIQDNIIIDTKDNSSPTHSDSMSQSQTETFPDEYLTKTIEQSLETLQGTPFVEQSTVSVEDLPSPTLTISTESLITTLKEKQTSTEGTSTVTLSTSPTTVSEKIVYQTTASRDRSLHLEDEDQLTTQFNIVESLTPETEIVQEKVDSRESTTMSETSGLETTELPTTSATSESTLVESASTLTTGQMTQSSSSVSIKIEQTSHPPSVPVTMEQTSHPTSVTVTKEQTSQPTSVTVTKEQTSQPTSVTVTKEHMSHPPSVTVTTEQPTHPPSVTVTTEQTTHPTSAPVTTEQMSHSTSVSVTTEQTPHQGIGFITSEQTSPSTTEKVSYAPNVTVTTGHTSQSSGVTVTTRQTSHPTSDAVTTAQTSDSDSVSVSDIMLISEASHTTSVSTNAVSSSTEHVTEIATSAIELQTTKPLSTTTVGLMSETTVTTKMDTSTHTTEKAVTPMTTEVVSNSTSKSIIIDDDKTTFETNRINCTPSEDSLSTTTTGGENSELPIMKNVKSYDDLSEPEFFNSVTVIFKKPEFETKDSMYFNQDVFKKVVVCLLNVYEAEEWSNEVVNVTVCNFKENESAVEDFTPLKPNDLVIVYPSPKDNHDEEIVSFFVKNNTVESQIVSRNRTLLAIGQHQQLLSEQMGMEVVDVYGRIPVSLLIASEEKAFHVRHSMLLVILLAVVSSCILAIMTALFCIKCKTQRGRWAREIHDKTQLQGDANKKPDMGDHLNSDEDIRKDESIRAFKNGNGYYGTENGSGSTVINITDTNDAWVVPYNQLTADEKAVPETLDTKL